MYFLDNGSKRRKSSTRKRRRVTKHARLGRKYGKGGRATASGRRRRVRRAARMAALRGRTVTGQFKPNRGGSMARRRRRTRVRHSAPRRRRRRRSVLVLRANPHRRRRRRVTHRRRSYRRNPGGTGVVATIKQGVMDGALVLVGQAVQGRASALAGRFVPVGGIAGEAITGIGSAVVVAIAARKFVRGERARMITAGAFSNAVRRIVSAVSPTAAGLLGDSYGLDTMGVGAGALYDANVFPSENMGAYPGGGLGAYPGGGLGDSADDQMASYIS